MVGVKYTVELVYQDYNIFPASISGLTTTNFTTTAKLKNIQRREADYNAKLVIDYPTTDVVDSFHKDVQDSSSIKNGSVRYYLNQHTGIESFDSYAINFKKGNYDYTEFYVQDWFSQKQEIANHILAKWHHLHIEQDVKISLGPQQCYKAQMVASFYKDVLVPYQAKAIFSAKDAAGGDVLDNNLIDLAKQVFNNGLVFTLVDDVSHRSSLTFVVSGYIKHDILHDVEVDMVNC